MATQGDQRGGAVESQGLERGAKVAGILAGAVALLVVSVDGQGRPGGAAIGVLTIYGRAHVILALALLSAALTLTVVRAQSAKAALLAVVVLWGAQLGGVGVVAYRRWPHYYGCCSNYDVSVGAMKGLAAAMAVTGGAAAGLAVAALLAGGHLRWRGSGWRVLVAWPLALAVLVAVPRLVVGGWGDVREVGARVVMYAVPIAVAIAVSALLDRAPALVLLSAVAVDALLLTQGRPFVELGAPRSLAMSLVIMVVGLLALLRLLPLLRSSPPKAEPVVPA